MSGAEKGWEKVQIRAFTSWLNGYLTKRNLQVENISLDLDDGVNLINFLELLAEKKVTSKWNPKPPTRIQKIENLHIALTFLDKEIQHKTSGTSAEDFADHNLKMILGFLWTLYKRYRIATIKHEDKSSEEGLLLWCKQKTQGYEGVEIENYKHSFKDGMAFGALCDSFLEGNKEVLDYDVLKKDNASANLATVFDIAEKHLGVPKLLDVEDVLEGSVDERSMVLYISLFFHAFNAKEQQRGATEERERMASEMKGLQGTLEERAKLAAQLQLDNESLRERLSALEKKFDEEKAAREAAEAEVAKLRAELEEERKKNKALEAGKAEMESQLFSFEGQVSDLTSRFNSLEKGKKQLEDENGTLSEAQSKGLGVLKKNLEEHLEDLHRWQAFLDFEKVSDVDFSGEIRPAILAEIKSSDFNEQLDKIAQRLGKENEELLNLLKSKESEKAQALRKDQEKKERQAKK